MIENPKIGQDVWTILPCKCAAMPGRLLWADKLVSFDEDTIATQQCSSIVFTPRKWVFATRAEAQVCLDALNRRAIVSTDRMNTPETDGLNLWDFHSLYMRETYPEKYGKTPSGCYIGSGNALQWSSRMDGVGIIVTTANADGFPIHTLIPEDTPANVPAHTR